MEVKQYSLDEWKTIAKDVHFVCFNELREEDENTFDFALMVVKDDVPQCYTTCIEFDKFSCYMQHGGRFPSARGSVATFNGYKKMIEYLHEKYPRLLTKTKNTNIPMLKLSFATGFIVHGIDVYGSEVFVKLINDKKELANGID